MKLWQLALLPLQEGMGLGGACLCVEHIREATHAAAY